VKALRGGTELEGLGKVRVGAQWREGLDFIVVWKDWFFSDLVVKEYWLC
jgi:hypothetical protein